MRIEQITSKFICGPERVGQWYCSDMVIGSDGEPIHRYLQLDGTWYKNTAYFPSKEELDKALAKNIKPDFNLSKDEIMSRDCRRAWQDSEDSFENDNLNDTFEY